MSNPCFSRVSLKYNINYISIKQFKKRTRWGTISHSSAWQKFNILIIHSVGEACGSRHSPMLLVGMQNSSTTVEENTAISNKITYTLTLDPTLTLTVVFPEDIPPRVVKYIQGKFFIATLFLTAQYIRWPKCLHTGDRLNKLWNIQWVLCSCKEEWERSCESTRSAFQSTSLSGKSKMHI